MTLQIPNKKKIINDPVYGFIKIPYDIIYDLISHPYFQRLGRIKQLGLTYLVYPGALHTRFSHALGSMHLMTQAIDVIRSKGHNISDDEAKAVTIAILLHDIGHGPFSHSLENNIIHNISHDEISLLFMEKLNSEFNGQITLAIKIFKNEYERRFLHQLVSSQLDVDRLDYLTRDSFYTGVAEGEIGYDRIIKMLQVKHDELVVEHKGIYSIENFLSSRRLMHWQVYYHKTVISAQYLLRNILKRAKFLAENGYNLFSTEPLKMFLYNKIEKSSFFSTNDRNILYNFALLDDYDIFASIKEWTKSDDKILSILCEFLVNRKLYKVELENKPFPDDYIEKIKNNVMRTYNIKDEIDYFIHTGSIENNPYEPEMGKINILYNNGQLIDFADASDQVNPAKVGPVKRYFLYYPKNFII